MEGPSLYLAAQQLAPFKNKQVIQVQGNTKTIDVADLKNKQVKDIFSWGKHLVFQFDSFALRIHFLMFGTFEATVAGKAVTGDYKKKVREPRLALEFNNGHVEMYSCSVKRIESRSAKAQYDFSTDLMSEEWDPKRALKRLREQPDEQIADVLLDQKIFSGLGNIIKNEILLLARIKPTTKVAGIPISKQKVLVGLAETFSRQFYQWRKRFELRKNLRIHRKRVCPLCGKSLTRKKTGKQQRWSYYCVRDQI
jgi:endonuclease-8